MIGLDLANVEPLEIHDGELFESHGNWNRLGEEYLVRNGRFGGMTFRILGC